MRMIMIIKIVCASQKNSIQMKTQNNNNQMIETIRVVVQIIIIKFRLTFVLCGDFVAKNYAWKINGNMEF